MELLVVVAVVGILASTAVPGLLRSRIAANEASAIGSLRAIVSAQEDFASLGGGFADDLATLAGICPGSSLPFVSADLNANGVLKSGYVFDVAPGATSAQGSIDCFGNPTATSYYVTAAPQQPGATGNLGFATNTAAAIWQDDTGVPPSEPFTMTATVSPFGS